MQLRSDVSPKADAARCTNVGNEFNYCSVHGCPVETNDIHQLEYWFGGYRNSMGDAQQTTRSPAGFFALTFLLSAPLYVLNALAFQELLWSPRLGALYITLLTFTPAAAAALLTWRAHGTSALKVLLLRVFDYQRIRRRWWYLPTLLVGPVIFAMSVGWIVLTDTPVPPPMVPLVALPVVFTFVFLLAAGEEAGWMGYAFEPLEARCGALRAALGLGVIWAIWHIPFFVFLFPNSTVFGAELLTLITARILLVWLFINTGKSVFVATLYHAADNTAFMILPDIKSIVPTGSVVHCVITIALALIVILLWNLISTKRLRSRPKGQKRP